MKEELNKIFDKAEQLVWADMEMLGKNDHSYKYLNSLGLLFSYLHKASMEE